VVLLLQHCARPSTAGDFTFYHNKGGYDHIGYRCERTRRHRLGTVNEACPAPSLPITNPFQPLEDFFQLKAGENPFSKKSDCQSLDSSLLGSSGEISSSDISDLFPTQEYDDEGISANVDWDLNQELSSPDQTDQQTDIATVNDMNTLDIPEQSTDNINMDIEYGSNLFTKQDETANIPDFAQSNNNNNGIQSTDQNLLFNDNNNNNNNNNFVAESNQISQADNLFHI
jgi:hypothetical protein